MIYGSEVLGERDKLGKIVKKFNVNEIIIAIPSARGEEIRKYVRLCSEMKVGLE